MIIHEITHIALCGIIAIIGFKFYRSFWVWIAAYAAGFLVDADHLVDYFIYRRGFSFSPAEFSTGGYFEKAGKIFLFLHSYELALVLIVVAAMILLAQKTKKHQLPTIFIVIAFSLILHLLYDTIYYKPDWNTYFLIGRVAHHFNLSDFHFH